MFDEKNCNTDWIDYPSLSNFSCLDPILSCLVFHQIRTEIQSLNNSYQPNSIHEGQSDLAYQTDFESTEFRISQKKKKECGIEKWDGLKA